MVVGLVERPDAMWFFKILGPVDQVNLAEPVWREFFGKLKFDEGGKPAWELPDGWSNGRSSSMRFATLNLNKTTPPLEMSISSLGPNQSLLDNVNRWRGQLGLDPVQQDELKLNSSDFDGGSMRIFEEVGMASSMGGGPMMRPQNRPPMVPDTPTPNSAGIKVDPIDGWEVGPSSNIVKARFLKKDGDKKAQVTVVEMAAEFNEWGANVDRWVSELGIEALSKDEIAARTSTVNLDGVPAQQVRLVEDDIEKATIAIMATKGNSAWFIKLSGDHALVKETESQFEKFLTSIKFQNAN